MPIAAPIRVFGLTRSYFTRKVTGYFDYKGIPWTLRPFAGGDPEVLAAGWSGGIPALRTGDGEFMWDSSAVIEYCERVDAARGVLPPDPTQPFLCYLLEDLSDEWLYRCAVGTRWCFPENAEVTGWELGREVAYEMPLSCDDGRAMVGLRKDLAVSRHARPQRTGPTLKYVYHQCVITGTR